MAARRPLGDILMESGRITQDDVAQVLDYQREHGGFFGQALVALGVVTREEIDWALANQFDLPLVFPHANAVDREVAHLVPAEWALAHLAVPIIRAGDIIRLVVADPTSDHVADDLRSRTGCQVEVALASAERIRQLIHHIYADSSAQRRVERERISLRSLLTRALDAGAARFGVSARGVAAVGWWEGRGGTHRAPLLDGWDEALAEAMDPAYTEYTDDADPGMAEWDATMARGGTGLRLHARALIGEGGVELMFVPLQKSAPVLATEDVDLPAGIATELQLLWGGGAAGVAVYSPDDHARPLLPRLPILALGPHVRTAHVTAGDRAPGGVLTLRPGQDDGFVASVAAHRFDALSIDLPLDSYPVAELAAAASIAFVLVDSAAPADSAGLNWLLTVSGAPGAFAWDLRALHR